MKIDIRRVILYYHFLYRKEVMVKVCNKIILHEGDLLHPSGTHIVNIQYLHNCRRILIYAPISLLSSLFMKTCISTPSTEIIKPKYVYIYHLIYMFIISYIFFSTWHPTRQWVVSKNLLKDIWNKCVFRCFQFQLLISIQALAF